MNARRGRIPVIHTAKEKPMELWTDDPTADEKPRFEHESPLETAAAVVAAILAALALVALFAIAR